MSHAAKALAPFPPGYQFHDANGNPLSGGLIETYLAGTTTPRATYKDEAGAALHANPIVLLSDGRAPGAVIWLDTALPGYKFIGKTSAGVTLWTVDNLYATGDPNQLLSAEEWQTVAATPTFIDATHFSVSGDFRESYQVGRRARPTDDTTLYGTVQAATYAAGPNRTTVTVLLDSGSLSGALTAVDVGFLSADNPAIPSAAGAWLPGDYKDTARTTAPPGWLMCYGQAISRGLYAALFGAIGVAYGVGDGSTTFNLPDFRGRVGAGRDDMGGSAAGRLTNATLTPDGNTLGAVGGAQTHALTEAEGPAHNHGGATGSHNHGGATGSHNHGGATGSHNHGGATGSHDHGGVTGFHVHNTRYGTGDGGVAAPALRADAATTAQNGNFNAVTDDRAASIAADTASIAADTASIAADTASIAADTASIASSGSGTAHTNTQPTMIVNKMIKT